VGVGVNGVGEGRGYARRGIGPKGLLPKTKKTFRQIKNEREEKSGMKE